MPKPHPTSFFDQLVQRLVKRSQRQHVLPLHAPEMLLIGCVDARLNPAEDIGMPDGAALTYRNIGAQVYGKSDNHDEAHLGEEAALEYAVKVKGVKDIVVMGHTHCGGIGTCCGGHDHGQASTIPHIDAYMKPVADACRDIIGNKALNEDQKRRAMEKAAVSQSIDNLRSYDWIRDLEKQGKVRLHGWVIDTATKVIFEMNGKTAEFAPMRSDSEEKSPLFRGMRIKNEERLLEAADRVPGEALAAPKHEPRALIIGGVDERVTAHTLGIKHGEALLYRNLAAYMPGTNDPRGNHNLSAAAVIEFATKVMKVPDIIVLGHRDSGGIGTALKPDRKAACPNIFAYLAGLFHSGETPAQLTQEQLEERSVKQSIANIKTYDGVQELIDSGKLHVRGLLIDPRDQHVEVLNDQDKFTTPQPDVLSR